MTFFKLIRNWLKPRIRRSPRLKHFLGRLGWQVVYFKDWWGSRVWKRSTEVESPLGFRFVSGVHPAYKLMRTGVFEPDETAVMMAVLPDTDVFVDVGANVGYYCCLALQNDVDVVAFEPQPQNLERLCQNLMINGWDEHAEVYPMALSEHRGLLTLYGASGPSASLVKNWAGYSPRFSQLVPASTLDNILAGRFLGERLLLKVDVEGAEFPVMKGAQQTLARDPKPVWLIELCLHEFHPDGMNPDYLATFELFWNHGYECVTATSDRRPVTRDEVVEWCEQGRTESGTFNYVFLDSASRLR